MEGNQGQSNFGMRRQSRNKKNIQLARKSFFLKVSPKKGQAGEFKQCLDLGLDKKKVVVENLGGEGHEVEGVKSPGEEQVEGQGTPPPHVHYYAPRPVIKKQA